MVTQEVGQQTTLLCPYCWEAFERRDILWMRQGGVEEPAPDAPAVPPPPASALEQAVNRLLEWTGLRRPALPPPPPVSPQDIETPRIPVCPACKRELPRALLESRPLFIGLVGGPGSGKTTYLISLLDRVFNQADLGVDGCIRFYPNEGTSARFQQAHTLLFRDHEPFELTAFYTDYRPNDPWVWEMTIQAEGTAVPYTVLFFDASGEQLEIEEDRRKYLKYLYFADGFILFADPSEMPEPARWLRSPENFPIAGPPDNGLRQEPQQPAPEPPPEPARPQMDGDPVPATAEEAAADGGAAGGQRGYRPRFGQRREAAEAGEPPAGPQRVQEPQRPAPRAGAEARAPRPSHEFFESIRTDYNRRRGVPAHEKIRIPVALVISKADQLTRVQPVASDIRDLLPPLPLHEDAQARRRRDRYRRMEMLETTEKVKSVLERIAPPAMNRSLQAFDDLSYHVASATGCGRNQQDRFPHVTPQGVVEPFASLLLRLGVIGRPPAAGD